MRAADLLQHTFVHDDNAIGEGHRFDLVMGYVDRCRALFDVKSLDFSAHLFAELRVERADRLIHKHRLGTPDECPTDRHALHVAA